MLEQLTFNHSEIKFPVNPVKQELPVSSSTDFFSMVKENISMTEKKPLPLNQEPPANRETDARDYEQNTYADLNAVESAGSELAAERSEDTRKADQAADEGTVSAEKKKTDGAGDKSSAEDLNINEKTEKISAETAQTVLIPGAEAVRELLDSVRLILSGEKGEAEVSGLSEKLGSIMKSVSAEEMEKLPGFSELSSEEKKNFKKIFARLKEIYGKAGLKQSEALNANHGSSRPDTASLKELPVKDLQGFLENLLAMAEKRKPRQVHVTGNKASDSSGSSKVQINTETAAGMKSVLFSEGQGGMNMSDSGDSRENFSFSAGRNIFSARTAGDRSDVPGKVPEFRQSLQDIIDRARVTVRDSRNGRFSVKLYPEKLGNVNVNLNLENGVVHGRFLVENSEARDMMMQNLNNLREMMMESGIEVGEFSVNVSDQRENFKGDETENKHAGIAGLNGEKSLQAGEYEINSAALHDGRINMVI